MVCMAMSHVKNLLIVNVPTIEDQLKVSVKSIPLFIMALFKNTDALLISTSKKNC
jgi:hypothetical protein